MAQVELEEHFSPWEIEISEFGNGNYKTFTEKDIRGKSDLAMIVPGGQAWRALGVKVLEPSREIRSQGS